MSADKNIESASPPLPRGGNGNGNGEEAVEQATQERDRPGHQLLLRDGVLRLGETLNTPGKNRPVDDFFRSLAQEQRERAIAVILSGMGSNGTAGCQAIKAVGGLCIAQDPESAKYPSMP